LNNIISRSKWLLACLGALSAQAWAQGLAKTAESVRLELFGAVAAIGAIGAIALMIAGLNWKFRWMGDTCIGIAIAFGATAMVTWIRSKV
jgi:type IV secretory pathway VirB2 component (pilin)